MQKHPRVILVGPLPPPIGGVSSHIVRLASLLSAKDYRCTVIDGYPEKNKISLHGVDHKVFGGRWRWFEMLRFLCIRENTQGDIVHLHFSKMIGRMLLFFPLLFRRHLKIILTLHHGDQLTVFEQASWPVKLLVTLALRRMDKIVALSPQQLTFYQSLHVVPERLVLWEGVAPINIDPDPDLLPSEIRNIYPIEAGGEETILITSGYPNHYYGYDDCVELLDQISSRVPCRLIVSLYGNGADPLYEKQLRNKLYDHKKVIVLGPLPAAGFAALLSKASLYIRPSIIDSYGMAISDALDAGVPCLASDVCTRDPRCETFPVGNKNAFFKQAKELIERGRKKRSRIDLGPINVSNLDTLLKRYYYV